MVPASKPPDEASRLELLEAYEILDTIPEQVFDDITFLASRICDTPIALISLVDAERQWFKSRVGLDVPETHRDLAFCAHAIHTPGELFEVRDAFDDDRFADNPLVTDGPVRFYAGAPLGGDPGSALGTICVIDSSPRELDDTQREALNALSRQVMGQLDLRKAMRDLENYRDRMERYQLQLEKTNEELAKQRHTDALTGVHNRAAFDKRLDEEIHRARRYDHPVSLLIVDVDHFKTYNDTHGHQAGDTVLQELAAQLESVCRTGDFVARYGGEEFALILPETDIDGAGLLAERLRRAIGSHDWTHGSVTISVGAAELCSNTTSVGHLIERADGALYEAKRTGRDRVVEAPPA